jgi:hypothetical protein
MIFEIVFIRMVDLIWLVLVIWIVVLVVRIKQKVIKCNLTRGAGSEANPDPRRPDDLDHPNAKEGKKVQSNVNEKNERHHPINNSNTIPFLHHVYATNRIHKGINIEWKHFLPW